MKVFENAKVYIRGSGIVNTSIAFGKKIASIGGAAEGERVPLPENSYVLPAFIDIHVHGAGGADFMDGTASAFKNIDRSLAREGTARYLATTMTQSADKIKKALSAAAEFKKVDNGLIGVHLEGPFISRDKAGAQSGEYVSDPDMDLFGQFEACAQGCIKTVTLAPECVGAEEFIKFLKKKNVSVSVGHSRATYGEVASAISWGADKITHTFNAQSGIHHREIGIAGSALLFDELYAELIADGIHVSYPAIKLLIKCKPPDKIILITDSMRAKGVQSGESELGGQKVYVRDGQARLSDGTLAGSVLKMNEAVKNLILNAGIGLGQAVDFASYNPAKYLGLKDCGSIACGNSADFCVTDESFNVLYTVRNGEIIYKKN